MITALCCRTSTVTLSIQQSVYRSLGSIDLLLTCTPDGTSARTTPCPAIVAHCGVRAQAQGFLCSKQYHQAHTHKRLSSQTRSTTMDRLPSIDGLDPPAPHLPSRPQSPSMLRSPSILPGIPKATPGPNAFAIQHNAMQTQRLRGNAFYQKAYANGNPAPPTAVHPARFDAEMLAMLELQEMQEMQE